MPKLTCGAETCIYNQDKYCIRNRIHVQGKEAIEENQTQCGSFKLKQEETGMIYGSSVIDVIAEHDDQGFPYSRFTYTETDEYDIGDEATTDDLYNALSKMGVDVS